jgi:hypothetical protein
MLRPCSKRCSTHWLKRNKGPELTDESERDVAALQASLVTALIGLKPSAGARSIVDGLASLDARVALSDWPLSVARNFQTDWRSWVARPWCCVHLSRLRRQLIQGDVSGPDQQDFERLVRTLALVEFGVDVDIVWYRRLRALSYVHGVTRIRKLLRSPWVWWGPSRSLRLSGMPPLLRQIFAMGRPDHGELHFKHPSRSVLWLLLVPAFLGCLLTVAGAALLAVGVGLSAYQLTIASLLLAKGASLLCTSWWLGLYGVRCIDELELLLGRTL